MAAPVEALRTAILENPEDDALRRVYADHLIERGDPRGLLIACQLAHDEVDDAKRLHLASRAERLAALHVRKLCAETAALDARYERGFLHAIRMVATDFVEHAPRLLAEEPIQYVALHIPADATETLVAALVAIPGLARIRDLTLYGEAGTPLAPFAHAPSLRRLHTLAIHANDVDLAPLVPWHHEALRFLLLDGQPDASAIELARSPHLQQVPWLYASAESGAVIGPVVDALTGLTHLAFSHTPENTDLRARGWRRAPSPRATSPETRRITEHVRASWDLWLRD